MHYKLVMGVPVCLGQWVTKIKRRNGKDKKAKVKKQNEINDIIYIYMCVCVCVCVSERESETQIYQNKIVNV